MKPENLQDAMNDIGEDLIEDAKDMNKTTEEIIVMEKSNKPNKPKVQKFLVPIAAALLIATTVGAGITMTRNSIPVENSNAVTSNDNSKENSKDTPQNSNNQNSENSSNSTDTIDNTPRSEYGKYENNSNESSTYEQIPNANVGSTTTPNVQKLQKKYSIAEESYSKESFVSETDYTTQIKPFLAKIINQVMNNTKVGSGWLTYKNMNKAYSPVSTYMTLSMLAEVTDGNTRQEILNLLGADSIEQVSAQAGDIWKTNYYGGINNSAVFSNYLFVNYPMNFKTNWQNSLYGNFYGCFYYAPESHGDYETEKMTDNVERYWLNNETGKMIENDYDKTCFFDRDEKMSIMSSVSYNDYNWVNAFDINNTKKDTFHSPYGDISCDFMNDSYSGCFYYGDNFVAIKRDFTNSDSMWLILPNENVSVSDLYSDSEMMNLITSKGKWDNCKKAEMHISIPKFDISSSLDLKQNLINLGVKNCFDSEKADFSPLTDDNSVVLSDITQDGYIIGIDEMGLSTKSYTELKTDDGKTNEASENDFYFTLDKPFITVITSNDGLPLHIGEVNIPGKTSISVLEDDNNEQTVIIEDDEQKSDEQ